MMKKMNTLAVWPGSIRIGLIGITVLLPFIGFAFNAFSYRWFYPQLLPDEWSISAWEKLFSSRSKLPGAFLTSISLAGLVTIVSLVIGLPAARMLGLYKFRFKRLVEFILIAPIMVPPLSIGMGLSVTFLRLGLGGTHLGVGIVHLIPVLPYVILTLSGVFRNYNTALEEQARTLGAGQMTVFFRITIPMVYPGVIVAGLFAFLISWSQYLLTMLIGGGRVITMPVLLFSMIPGGDNPAIAALSLLFILPSVLILIFTSHHLSGGTVGMKGLGRL
jgi:putative spermidine/putrescine transport system permease protein